MRDLMVANRASAGALSVDPSMISLLVRANASKPGLLATAQRKGSKTITFHRDQLSCPASNSSDTTGEPEGSEIESLGGSSSDGSAEAVRFKKQLPVGPQPKKKPQKERSILERTAATECERRLGKKTAGGVPTNSSPADFAAAWKVAADVGLWNGDQHSVVPTKPRKVAGNKSHASKNVSRCVQGAGEEDIPLPKWFAPDTKVDSPPAITPPPGLGPPGVFEDPKVKTDVFVEQIAKSLQEGLLAMAGAQLRQQELFQEGKAFSAAHDSPLKVILANSEYEQPRLNPALPCKKRVPDWSF